MSQSTLSYDDFKKINELIEGYTNVDKDNLALANRVFSGQASSWNSISQPSASPGRCTSP